MQEVSCSLLIPGNGAISAVGTVSVSKQIPSQLPSFSTQKSQSIRTRLSGKVYRSTWNSPSADLVRNAMLEKGGRQSYAQRRSWYMYLPSCCYAPSQRPVAGLLGPDAVSCRLAFPCRPVVSIKYQHQNTSTWILFGQRRTPFSGRFRFLAESSARLDFTPFSSLPTGPDSLSFSSRLGLGFLKFYSG